MGTIHHRRGHKHVVAKKKIIKIRRSHLARRSHHRRTRIVVHRKPKVVVHKRTVHKRRTVVKKPKVVAHKRYHRRRNWTVAKYKGYHNKLYAAVPNRRYTRRSGRALVLRYKKYWA